MDGRFGFTACVLGSRCGPPSFPPLTLGPRLGGPLSLWGEPFERSSHGLLPSNRATGSICPSERAEAPRAGARRPLPVGAREKLWLFGGAGEVLGAVERQHVEADQGERQPIE